MFDYFLLFLLQVWIQPEHPRQLAAMFRNLTDIYLACIFPECDISWTLFLLDAAPNLQNFKVSLLQCLLIYLIHTLAWICDSFSASTTSQQVYLFFQLLTNYNLPQIVQSSAYRNTDTAIQQASFLFDVGNT